MTVFLQCRPISESVWTTGAPGGESCASPGAVSHAPFSVLLPLQHVLWGKLAECGHCRGAEIGHRLSLA